MIRLVCLLGLFAPLSAFSQVKLNGKVTGNDGSPASYATVQLLGSDSVAVKSDMTREDGSFELITKAGNYTLRVSQFGKAIYSKNLLLNGDQNLGLITVNIINTLDMVNISANKPVVRQDFDKFIFYVENSPLKIGYNGLEVLARAPKLQVNAAGEVLLRNSSPLIMINGRKQNLTGEELSSYLASLNAEMIKSIEIQSLGSANADALAKGGVVNIILKKAPVGFSSTLNSSYTYRKSNIWSGYTGLNNNYGGDKWNFYSKIGYRWDNDYGNFKTIKDFIRTGGSNLAIGSFKGLRKNLNILGGLVFYPDEKQEFGTEFYFNKGNGNYGTAENLVVRDAVLSVISDNFRRDLSETKVWYTTLNYTLKTDTLSSTIKFIVDVGRNNITKNNNTDTRYTFGNLPANLTNYLIQPLSDYYTLQADWHQQVSKAWSVNGGLKYGSVNRNNTLQTQVLQDDMLVLTAAGQENFYNRENISAGYFSVSVKSDERNSFKLGLRMENTAFSGENRITDQTVKQNHTGFFPSIYYRYAIEKDKTLSFNYSRSIQRPSFNDLNPFIRKENDYSYILGNPHLKPQYTNTLELSYQSGGQSFSIFGSVTNDVIAGVYNNENNVTYYKPVNFGRQQQVGADFSYHSDLTKWLYASIGGAVYYYEFQKDQLNPSRLAFQSNFYTRFKLSKSWSADLTNNLKSRLQNYVVSVAPQYRMELVLQKTIWAEKGTVKFFWNDIWNTQRDKNFSTYQDFTLDFYQKRRTQSYMLMFIYNFKTKHGVKNKAVESNNDSRNRLQ